MAELASIINFIIKAGTKLVHMLQQVQNNNHKIQELIQLIKDVCSVMKSNNMKKTVGNSIMLSVERSLMEALQDAEKQVCAYREKNAARRALMADAMTEKLCRLRREIMDRMAVLAFAIDNDNSQELREIKSWLKKLLSNLPPRNTYDEKPPTHMIISGQPQFWDQDDVMGWQSKARKDVTDALSLPEGLGIPHLLLRHCHWRPQQVKDEWRQRRDEFCRHVGLRWPSGASKPEVIRTKRNHQFCYNNSCPRG